MNEVVYNEDLVKTVKNKYLAVNVVAKRARDINANGLPLASSSNTAETKKKPVAIATQELINGKLHFEKSEVKVPNSKTPSIFTDAEEPGDGSDIFDEEILEQENDTEAVEREEGL
jgi:DNA-directed RNA polymerase omega subunit